MSLLPRFVSNDFPRIASSDLTPVWRLLDDYANQVISARNEHTSQSLSRLQQTFNPRFDVKEAEAAYELKGELPGVEQKNIEIEFPDQQTIVIKGSTGYSREEQPTHAQAQAEPEQTSSEHNHQATVEDEPEIIDAAEASTTDGTPVATPQSEVAKPETTAKVNQPQPQSSRYWVSERYTGSFQRTFSFPAPVDTDNTTARLHNGVLEVTIPKKQKADIKRIAVN